jgi:hypothetical protein
VSLEHVLTVYDGSDGDATKALYAFLEEFGPIGHIAVNLFRAQKNSARAKVYRGRGFKGAAYYPKQWALDNLATALDAHAAECSMVWGWGTDSEQPFHNQVLYVDLPTGQVSFHTDRRGIGPDYPHAFDGKTGLSPDRIIRFIARLTAERPDAA